MTHPLLKRLPPVGQVLDEADEILDRFVDYVGELGVELYPAQEEALLELLADKNVILATPTGSGKSLVALALHFKAMCRDRRSVYTSPVKALVNEKFFDLCEAFHPDNVGLMTGDAAVNRDAPILCCTAEILANMALRQGDKLDLDEAILDEFHFYGDQERGVAWQVPLLTLPQTRFLLMSATLGDMDGFEDALTRLNGRPSVTVRSEDRPVPLDYVYAESPLHMTVARLIEEDKAPIYLVNFTQKDCHDEAQSLMSVNILDKDGKAAIAELIKDFRFDTPYGKSLQRFVRHGIGVHHGGMLPKYRRLVERLAKAGMLKVISGTDTLGVGVNIPIRTVLLTKLYKYDGRTTAILSVRDFKQICGRAGRRGYDDAGTVVAQAPVHVVENIQLAEKAQKKSSKKKPKNRKAPRGYVAYNRATFDKLQQGQPEPLASQFRVSHAMLLSVLGREQGGCQAMKQLLRNCHERSTDKHREAKTAISLFHSLMEAEVISLVPAQDERYRRVQVNLQLQEDFSLVHTLSLYVLNTLPQLDVELETHAVDVLSLVEAILLDPTVILRKQLDRIKGEAVAHMKAEGIEYDERMAELEKLDYPRPNATFIYSTFNEFAHAQPWVGTSNIRPKGVAREIFDECHDFRSFVQGYKLERSEGVVLRYVTEVYKALVQTVPLSARTEAIEDLIAFFGTVVRGVDSSLLDEWEQLRDPDYIPTRGTDRQAQDAPVAARGITADMRGFTVLVRNTSFRLVQQLARGDYEAVAEFVQTPEGQPRWTGRRIEEALVPYYEEHPLIRTDPAARGTKNLHIDMTPERWTLRQILVDPEDHNDWWLHFVIDLAASDLAGLPVMELHHIGR